MPGTVWYLLSAQAKMSAVPCFRRSSPPVFPFLAPLEGETYKLEQIQTNTNNKLLGAW